MSTVNEETPAPVEKRKGKQKLPIERRRVILSVRVLPSTMEYLESMAAELGVSSTGRAVDTMVQALQGGGIARQLDNNSPIEIVKLTS